MEQRNPHFLKQKNSWEAARQGEDFFCGRFRGGAWHGTARRPHFCTSFEVFYFPLAKWMVLILKLQVSKFIEALEIIRTYFFHFESGFCLGSVNFCFSRDRWYEVFFRGNFCDEVFIFFRTTGYTGSADIRHRIHWIWSNYSDVRFLTPKGS